MTEIATIDWFGRWGTSVFSENTAIFSIIPIPHQYAYFAQLDWLEKKFYTSINSMSRNLRTVFLPPAPKMYNNVDSDMILMTKLEL